MDSIEIIKAIEEHAAEFGIKPSSIGQYAANNKHAYERIKAGTAHRDTEKRVIAWMQADRARREATQ